MKKLFQNRTVAVAVLIVAVVLGVVIGQIKKPASFPKVSYGTWICDDAGILSPEIEKELNDYNRDWNETYNAVIAVATVKSVKGWKIEAYTDTLGKKWGLGEKDMLLVIYPKESGVEYWVSQGAYLQENQMDYQQHALKTAIENEIYANGAEAGAIALFYQADTYYAQVLGRSTWNQGATDSTQWRDRSGVSVFRVVLLVIAIIVVWAIIDRFRYNRYRRRSVTYVGGPAVKYYPIFWGRPSRAAAPRPPVPPSHAGSYHSPARPSRPSGTYPTQKPRTGQSAPTRPANRPGNSSRPSGFGKGGFGGGKR